MAENKQKDTGGNAQFDAGAKPIPESGRHTNFAHASPESNVGPAGAPQTSHGNAAGRGIPGGTEGRDGKRANSELGMGAAAAGGDVGSAATADQGMSRQDGSGGSVQVDSAGTLERVRDRDSKIGPADTPEP